MRIIAGRLLGLAGILAIGYAEIVTLIWVYNEHGVGWMITALVFLPSTLVLSFIAEFWYGLLLVAGLALAALGRYMAKGYWETDEDHMLKLAAEQAKLRDEE